MSEGQIARALLEIAREVKGIRRALEAISRQNAAAENAAEHCPDEESTEGGEDNV